MKIRIPWFYLEFIGRSIKKKKVRAILGFLGMMISVSLIVSMNVLIDSLAADSLRLATSAAGETDVVLELVPADVHDVFSWAFNYNITRRFEIINETNTRGWDGPSLTNYDNQQTNERSIFNSWFNATEILSIFNNQEEIRGVIPRLILDSDNVRTSSNKSSPFPTTLIFINMTVEDDLEIGSLVPHQDDSNLPVLELNQCYVLPSVARSLNVKRGDTVEVEIFPFGKEDPLNISQDLGFNGTLDIKVSSIVKNQERFESGLSNAILMDYSMIPVVFQRYNVTSNAIIANQVVGVFPNVGGVQGGAIYNYRDLDGMKEKTLKLGEKFSTLIPYDQDFPEQSQQYHIMFSITFPRVQAILFIAEISTIARVLLDFMAAIALVIGGVLIYSLQTVSVEERIRDFAIMRTVGGKRRHIWIMVAIEGLSIVIMGSIFGIFMSLGLAPIFMRIIGFTDIPLVISEISILTGLFAGFFIGILSSLLPAYRSTATSIVKGLDPLRQAIPEVKFSRERGVNLTLLGVGIVMTITAAVVVVAIPQVLFSGGFIWLAFLIFGLLLVLLIGLDLISVSLLIPVMEFLFSIPLGLLGKTRKVKDIVVRSLRRNRRRTTATAVMFSLSFAFVFFIGVNLEINAVTAEYDAVMQNGSDVVLTSQQTGFFFFFFGSRDRYYFHQGAGEQIKNEFLNEQSFHVDSETLQRYNRSLVFSEVTPTLSYARTIPISPEENETKEYNAGLRIGDASLFDSTSCSLFGISPNFLDVIYNRFSFHQGNLNDIETVAKGELNTAIISTALASEFNLKIGDPLRLSISTQNGTSTNYHDYLNLSVRAVLNAVPGFSGFSTSSGFLSNPDILVSRNTWTALREIIRSEKAPLAPFGNIPIHKIFYDIEDPTTGPDPEFELEIATALGEFLSVYYPDSGNEVTVEEVEDAKEAAASGQTLFSAIMSLAVIISFFGLTSSMYSAVQESQFEIGVLKSMGLRNSDVRNYLIFESTILTLSSGSCGALIGYILAYTFEFQSASFSDSPIIFVVPWFLLVFLFITSLIVGILGAVIPGRVVVSKNPVEILRRI
ncbi:MAG: ABC transporter permease [Candidatus Hodarchaeota archaeon]